MGMRMEDERDKYSGAGLGEEGCVNGGDGKIGGG